MARVEPASSTYSNASPAGQLLAPANDPGDFRIIQFDVTRNAAFAVEMKPNRRSVRPRVMVSDRRQSNSVRLFSRTRDSRHGSMWFPATARPWQESFPLAIPDCGDRADAAPNTRQRLYEFHHPIEFIFVPHRAELRMISVLLSSPIVATDRLNVTSRRRTNPDRFPCRGNHQRCDSRQRLSIANHFPSGIAIDKSRPAPLSDDPRALVDLRKSARRRCRLLRIGRRLGILGVMLEFGHS